MELLFVSRKHGRERVRDNEMSALPAVAFYYQNGAVHFFLNSDKMVVLATCRGGRFLAYNELKDTARSSVP